MVYIGLEHCRLSDADNWVLFGCRVFSLSFFMFTNVFSPGTGQTTGWRSEAREAWFQANTRSVSENFVFSFVTFRWVCLIILHLFLV